MRKLLSYCEALSAVPAMIGLAAVFAYSLLVARSLWGSWQLLGIEPDTPTYLKPVAAALFQGGWDHLQRPFGYPALAYVATRIGGSIDALVALQLGLYALACFLIYAAVLGPLSRADRTPGMKLIAPLVAVAAAIGYFQLSSHLLALAFYVVPELVSSTVALTALTLCLILIGNRQHGPLFALALAILSSLCAALLVAFKPSMIVTAALTLAVGVLGLIRQSHVSRLLLGATLAAMIAMPSATLLIDNYLARKYESGVAWGALMAFCNNADLIVTSLEKPSGAGRRILGEDGSREVANFLRHADTGDDHLVQGFDEDNCMWHLWRSREELEKRYFGATPDDVAQTYRRLVIASVLEAPVSYASRVGRQLMFFLVADQVTCNPQYQNDWRGQASFPEVDRLISLYHVESPTSQALPTAPGADVFCSRLAPVLKALQLPLLLLAIAVAIFDLVAGRARIQAAAVLLSTGFWLSSSVIVALVETFDREGPLMMAWGRQRYVTVMFPVYMVMLAIAAGYLAMSTIKVFYGAKPNFSSKAQGNPASCR
jgi:hypothetical protein